MKYFLTLLAILLLSLEFFSCKKGNQFHTGTWTKKADFPGTQRESIIAFTIANKAYAGSGGDLQDFYEYDPSINTWTRKADIPGAAREQAVGFSIGNKGYILTGTSYSINLKDMWEYDSGTDTWTQKNDFPGIGRYAATGFSIGNKGYFGTGVTDTAVGQQLHLEDWWEYDPSTDTWKQKANFPGEGRGLATSLATNGKGYLGFGSNNYELEGDWWEYDPITDTWTQKADFPAGVMYGAAGFGVGTKCYVGNGGLSNSSFGVSDWWEFDVLNNKWTKKASQLQDRFLATAFVINGTGYVGTGYSNTKGLLNDLWEFVPN